MSDARAPRPAGATGDVAVRRLTAPGPAALALLAVDGPGAGALLRAALRPRRPGAWPAPGRFVTGHLLDPDGLPVDEVVLARAASGAAAFAPAVGRRPPVAGAQDGGERYEVSCHGGPACVARVVAALVARGAREAEAGPDVGLPPGDDRTADEARLLLPRATTALGAQALLAQADGALGAWAQDLAARLAAAPDDGAPGGDAPGGDAPSTPERAARAAARGPGPEDAGAAAEVARALDDLAATIPLGRALLAPPRVALVGAPNAGKSSLFNALTGRARALVSPVAGTTRDALEQALDLDGVPLVLVDTAGDGGALGPARQGAGEPGEGARPPEGGSRDPARAAIDALGVARAREVARTADLRVLVVDATTLPAPADATTLPAPAGATTLPAPADAETAGAGVAGAGPDGARGALAPPADAVTTLHAALAAAAPPRLVVLAQVDRLAAPEAARDLAARVRAADPASPVVPASSVTGAGLPDLLAALRRAVVAGGEAGGGPDERAVARGLVVVTPRQAGLVLGARRALARGRADKALACLAALHGRADALSPSRPPPRRS